MFLSLRKCVNVKIVTFNPVLVNLQGKEKNIQLHSMYIYITLYMYIY